MLVTQEYHGQGIGKLAVKRKSVQQNRALLIIF